MGGRGIHVKNHNSQISLDRHNLRNRIVEVRRVAEALREGSDKTQNATGQAGGGGAASIHRRAKKRCACCGHFSIPAYSQYEICPVCGWIDDPRQNLNPELADGANPISLNEAKRRWSERGKRE